MKLPSIQRLPLTKQEMDLLELQLKVKLKINTILIMNWGFKTCLIWLLGLFLLWIGLILNRCLIDWLLRNIVILGWVICLLARIIIWLWWRIIIILLSRWILLIGIHVILLSIWWYLAHWLYIIFKLMKN